MHAATPRLYFQQLCQHEVFRLYQHRTCDGTQAHFALVMKTMATRSMFFYFFEKRHKIVESFALLTTELSSYKWCKVGMLFCIL